MNTATDEETTPRADFIRALRACADFFEAHPSVDIPRCTTLNVFVDTKDDLARHARTGSWEKTYNGPWFYLTKYFGRDLQLDITAPRETICRRIVVGQTVEPAKMVDVVEWECADEAILAEAGR